MNGWLMKEKYIGSGVRQGSLSPVLFVCVIVPLLKMLLKDKCMKDVEVPGSGRKSLKAIGYMDDLTVVCSGMAGLRRVKLLIDIFCMVIALYGKG